MASSGTRQMCAGTALVALGLLALSAPISVVAADVQAGKAASQAKCIAVPRGRRLGRRERGFAGKPDSRHRGRQGQAQAAAATDAGRGGRHRRVLGREQPEGKEAALTARASLLHARVLFAVAAGQCSVFHLVPSDRCAGEQSRPRAHPRGRAAATHRSRQGSPERRASRRTSRARGRAGPGSARRGAASGRATASPRARCSRRRVRHRSRRCLDLHQRRPVRGPRPGVAGAGHLANRGLSAAPASGAGRVVDRLLGERAGLRVARCRRGGAQEAE